MYLMIYIIREQLFIVYKAFDLVNSLFLNYKHVIIMWESTVPDDVWDIIIDLIIFVR